MKNKINFNKLEIFKNRLNKKIFKFNSYKQFNRENKL